MPSKNYKDLFKKFITPFTFLLLLAVLSILVIWIGRGAKISIKMAETKVALMKNEYRIRRFENEIYTKYEPNLRTSIGIIRFNFKSFTISFDSLRINGTYSLKDEHTLVLNNCDTLSIMICGSYSVFITNKGLTLINENTLITGVKE